MRARSFDWDEARRLRAEGLSYTAIGVRLGVSNTAIYWATHPEEYARANARGSEWQKSGTCSECGGPASRNATRGQALCRRCASIKRATSARPGELRCQSCREWKPDAAFPRSRNEKYARRGHHEQCRECLTIAKRDWRRRNPGKEAATEKLRRDRKKVAAL